MIEKAGIILLLSIWGLNFVTNIQFQPVQRFGEFENLTSKIGSQGLHVGTAEDFSHTC